MKKIAALMTMLAFMLGLFSVSASADALELAEIYTEYGRGESIYLQGTSSYSLLQLWIFDENENIKYFESITRTSLDEGKEIPITDGWELGEYTMIIGYGSEVANEYHFTVVEEPVDRTPEKETSSGGRVVTATQISVSPSSLDLKLGETGTITVTSANSSVRWETDDNDKISISGTTSATFTAKKVGTATAWVYSGNNYATVTIKISPANRTTTADSSSKKTDTTTEKSDTADKTNKADETDNTNKADDDKADETEKTTDSFSDLDGVEWAKEAINALAADGIVNGMGGGVFAPTSNVTRAQFVKMIVEAFGFEGKGDAAFDDVSEGDWFADYVLVAANNGIVNGYGASFGPNDNIRCQDAALIIKRILDGKDVALPEAEADGETAEYAAAAVGELKAAEIIFDEMDFKPAENATRAQSAVLIYGALSLAEKTGGTDGQEK